MTQIIGATGTIGLMRDIKTRKAIRSPNYNFNFNKETGYFERWGKTKDDDPTWSEFGPEIADIEIGTICHEGCKFCYKSNTPVGTNMTIEVFKKVLDKIISNNV